MMGRRLKGRASLRRGRTKIGDRLERETGPRWPGEDLVGGEARVR